MSGRPRTNNAAIAGGLIALVAAGALFPLLFSQQGPKVCCTHFLLLAGLRCVLMATIDMANKTKARFSCSFTCPQPAINFLSLALQVDPSKPLSGQAGIRGPYTNTGSRDAGPDPDFKPVGAQYQLLGYSAQPLVLCLPSSSLQTPVWQRCLLLSARHRPVVWCQPPQANRALSKHGWCRALLMKSPARSAAGAQPLLRAVRPPARAFGAPPRSLLPAHRRPPAMAAAAASGQGSAYSCCSGPEASAPGSGHAAVTVPVALPWALAGKPEAERGGPGSAGGCARAGLAGFLQGAEILQQGCQRALAGALAAALLAAPGALLPPPAAAVLNSPNARIPRRCPEMSVLCHSMSNL